MLITRENIAIQLTNLMSDIDHIFFSSLDLNQDQVTLVFQFNPLVTATTLTETPFFKAFTRLNPNCEELVT